MIILGIDPGSRRIGYGLIKFESSLELLEADLIKITYQNNSDIISEIRREVHKLIIKFKPEILAIEKIYFSKNLKTAVAVAETRGVIISAALEKGLRIQEYSPNEIKAAITGYGLADKQAIAKMVRFLLHQPNLKVIDDVSDALAAAITATNLQIK